MPDAMLDRLPSIDDAKQSLVRYRGRSCVFFLPGLSAGGAERVLVEISAQFAAAGIVVTVISATKGGSMGRRLPANVELIELGKAKPFAAIRQLRSLLRARRPDALMASVTNANIAAAVSSLGLPGMRLVLREANLPINDIKGSAKARKRVGTQLAIRVLYRTADVIVALTEDMRSQIKALCPAARQITVIPNPARQFVEAPPSGTRYDPTLMMGCGRLETQKGFDVLLRALRKLRETHDAKLLIVGDGSQRVSLESLAAQLGVLPYVRFAGAVEDPEHLMRGAGVFVLSSRWEGFPNVVVEALGVGCPVVATDCTDAVRMLIARDEFGTICPVEDWDCIAAAVAGQMQAGSPRVDASKVLRGLDAGSIACQYAEALFGD